MDRGRPTTHQEPPKWYQTLWDLRDKTFRQWYIRTKKLEWHLYYKYEKHILLQKIGYAFIIAGVVIYLANTNMVRGMVHWPSDDINVLLTRPVWIEKQNELNKRREQAEKQLEDSTYIYNKNKG